MLGCTALCCRRHAVPELCQVRAPKGLRARLAPAERPGPDLHRGADDGQILLIHVVRYVHHCCGVIVSHHDALQWINITNFATAHFIMRRNGNKYERVPLQPVRKVGDPAFISDEQVVLKLKQSFGVSGVSLGDFPHVPVPALCEAIVRLPCVARRSGIPI